MDLQKEYNQLLSEIGKKNIRIEYETGRIKVTHFTEHGIDYSGDIDRMITKITHFPTDLVFYGCFSDSQIENKVNALNQLKRELYKRKREKYTSYSFLALTYLLSLLFAIFFSKNLLMEDLLSFWLTFFCLYSFSYFMLMMTTKIPEIDFKYFIYAFIGGFMILYIGKVYYDENQRSNMVNQIEKEEIIRREKEEEKLKFSHRVASLKAYIDQDSINIRVASELEIKQPHKYRINSFILSNKTITSKQVSFLPLKKVLDANAYFQLGLVHDQNNLKRSQAFSYYKKAVEIDSTIRDYHLKLATSACYIDEYNLAFKHFKIALDLDSTKTWITSEYFKLSSINLEYYQEKLEIEKDLYMQFAGIKFERRVSNLKAFIDQDSITMNDLLVLGIKHKKNLHSNILGSKNILNANTYFQIGKMYEQNLELNTAISYYKKAVETDVTNRNYHLRLASRASIIKNYDLAIKHYQIISDLNPNEIWIKTEIANCNLIRFYPYN